MALTSEKRICKVHSTLGPDALILTALTGREKVSGLFEFECQFSSEDPPTTIEEEVSPMVIVGLGLVLVATTDAVVAPSGVRQNTR